MIDIVKLLAIVRHEDKYEVRLKCEYTDGRAITQMLEERSKDGGFEVTGYRVCMIAIPNRVNPEELTITTCRDIAIRLNHPEDNVSDMIKIAGIINDIIL